MLQLSIDEYQVGWICALPCEYATAKAMLDEQHQMVSGQNPADSNSYTLGRMHNHNVVIACLPAGVDGTNAAAVVATNLSRTFRSTRFGLMVGIGGGIPNLQSGVDIRLGDIVVSQPSGRDGGVIQYDKGKSHDDHRFERKGQLNKPPMVLLTALSNLRAEHEIGDSRLPEYLDHMLQSRPKMRKLGYSFPLQVIDVLKCTHDNEAVASCEYCQEGEVVRPHRESTEPVVHYGVIASGNQVIKNGVHRDQLRDECGGAICVEMEAAGLMDNFPCLVIRGICDYADSSKNDRWHNYAAATAAAFAKELLLYVSAEQAGWERPVKEILSFLIDTQEYFQNQKQHNRQQELYAHQREIEKIPVVTQAIYGLQDEGYEQCHPDTRVDLRHQIQQWACHPHSKPIMWLSGHAGTGKSTISWTFAEWLVNQNASEQASLGASYFFRRGDGDRGSARRFFPTIIRQLITKIPGLDTLVVEAIKSNPLIFDTALAEQFRQLILHPLTSLKNDYIHRPTLIVVVDAFDECERQSDIETILKLWSQLCHLETIRLRLFLTSRPELTIRFQFRHMPTDIFQEIDLVEAVPSSTIESDLYVYIDDSFRCIRQSYNDHLYGTARISDNWPGHDTIQQLVNVANPLFIVAATICRFVGDLELDPRESLEDVLDNNQNMGQMSQMEKTYLPVLAHLVTSRREERQQQKLCHDFRIVVGSIVLLAEVLSVNNLALLLAVNPELIERQLVALHSVFHVPGDRSAPIRALHLSFADFLLGEKARTHPFGIDGPSTHLALRNHCLRVLSCADGLCENICDLDYPGKSRIDIQPTTINSRLSPVLQYACRYWIYHTKHSFSHPEDDGQVHAFLKRHFLHWLEALSLMDRISEAIGLLGDLQLCVPETAPGLSAFLNDAQRFVLAHRYIIDLAPLQLYSSAVIFTPQASLVRTICGRTPTWIVQHPKADPEWGPELQKLVGHSALVSSVLFSPDGSLLASGSSDETVRLWNVETGREMQRLEGNYGQVWAVSFSPDGSLIASGTEAGVVQLWDVQTGRETHILKWHDRDVSAVSFSPNGSLLASGSSDEVIMLWDVQTRVEVHTLQHPGPVIDMSFSPDGSLLASKCRCSTSSAPWDQTVLMWNLHTCERVYELEGTSAEVGAVSFSPDGSLLAVASYDGTIWLREVRTGQISQVLRGHATSIRSMSMSSHGSLLALGTGHWSIRLWDLRSGQEMPELEGHTSMVRTVSFSPISSVLVSASDDGIIRMWDTQLSRGKQKLDRQADGAEVVTIAFSPDGSFLASACKTGEITVWDAKMGGEAQHLVGHHNSVTVMGFSADGCLLASRAWDDAIRVWDRRTGRQIQKIRERSFTRNLIFSLDNALLTSTEDDETTSWAKVWDLRTGRRILEPTAEQKRLVQESRESRPSNVSNGDIAVYEEWICYKGQNLLWLPHEYRGGVPQGTNPCGFYERVVYHGDKVAIGADSGRVSIFQFDFSQDGFGMTSNVKSMI